MWTNALAACPHPWSRADVSQRDQIDRYMQEALARLGGLDVLVNNAGIAGPTAGIADIAPQELDATLDINLASQFHTVRHALPACAGPAAAASSISARWPAAWACRCARPTRPRNGAWWD